MSSSRSNWLDAQPSSAPRQVFAPVERWEELRDRPEVAAELERARADAASAAGADLVSAREQLVGAIENLDRAALDVRSASAADIVDLALVVARELVDRDFSERREPLIVAVQRGLEAIVERERTVVRVHIDDAAYVQEHLDDSQLVAVRVVGDPGLSPGSCIVETPDRVLDASIGARIEAVREALVDVLESQPEDGEC